MQISVSQLFKAPIGSVRYYMVSDNVIISGNSIASLVKGELSLTHTNRSILVKGRLHTEVEVSCCRCLNQFGCPLTFKIEDEYFPTTDRVSGRTLSLPNEPSCFIIDEHHVLDLTEAIRQYALLAIPMKPLCHENCAGLCPDCGRDLNQGSCNCPPQVTDSHWSVLRILALANNKQKGTE